VSALLQVVLPVFLVIGFGYLAAWRGLFTEAAVDGLTRFAQTFAIPCLLFQAMARLDLSADFDATLLASFYAGAGAGFLLGFFGARLLFGRPWEDCVAIGFCCLFSNSVLLGLPITERAYGSEALAGNYAIIALHSLFCYGIGITAMELLRSRGAPLRHLPGRVLGGLLRNALIIGILAGLAVNLSGLPMPGVLMEGVRLMALAALPAALFGLGGVLYRYRPEGDLRTIAYVCAVSLVAHPAITFVIGRSAGLEDAGLRSAVMTAAMAPGVNTYLFANAYGRARRVAASSVLIGTAVTVVTASLWIVALP
jgi:hypothetical protein